MMRRCILEFSSRRSLQGLQRVPRQAVTQEAPYFLSARKEFSSKSGNQNVPKKPFTSTDKPLESGSNVTKPGSSAAKLAIGGIAVGAAIAAAYKTGYLSQGSVEEEKLALEASNIDDKVVKDSEDLGVQIVSRDNQEATTISPDLNNVEKNEEAKSEVAGVHDPSKSEGGSQVSEGSYVVPEEGSIPVQQKDHPIYSKDNVESDRQVNGSEVSTGNNLEKHETENPSVAMETGKTEGPRYTLASPQTDPKVISEETDSKSTLSHLTSDDRPKDTAVNGEEHSSSLLDAYSLQKVDGSSTISSKEDTSVPTDGSTLYSEKREALGVMVEESKDAFIIKDGKLIVDFLQAIHAAEKEQADLDARIFSEEKRMLKEKYEKELKDARARQLMYAEEAAILDKELNKERAKAAAAIKSLQEKAEENLKMELEQKENEAKLQLEKVEALAKAELAAAIASEKASQIEKLADANLNINALCMAFYARSEEARQSHSVHKLALGALALEDALSKGLPIHSEIKAVRSYLEGIDKDSLLNLVLSSLPEETLNSGTDTQLQLNQKFDSLKRTLRHYSLIPPGGGGLLTHTFAHIATGLKVKEDDQSGDGIESVINRVEGLLVEGKLAEAADALEGGVSGSQAEVIISDWVTRARNRAITEQALSMLQSYATSISVT